jgi:hypothetical protein
LYNEKRYIEENQSGKPNYNLANNHIALVAWMGNFTPKGKLDSVLKITGLVA